MRINNLVVQCALLAVYVIFPDVTLANSIALQHIPAKSDENLLDCFMIMAESKDGSEQMKAVTALSQLADPKSIPVLIKLLKSDDMNIANGAVMALFAIGDPATAEDIFKMIDANRSSTSSEQAIGAIISMRNIHPDVILTRLNSSNIDVKRAAVASLGRCNHKDVDRLISKYLLDKNPLLQIAALIAYINKYSMQNSSFPKSSYECDMDSHDIDKVHEVPKIMIDQLYIMVKSRDRDVKYYAAEALSQSYVSDSRNVFLKLLNDSDSRVRSVSARALSAFPDSHVRNQLIRALSDGDGDVEESAAYSLGIIGGESAIKSMAKIIEDNIDDFNYPMIEAIATSDLTVARDALSKSLTSKNLNSKCSAAVSLGKYHQKSAYNILISEIFKLKNVNDNYKEYYFKECLTEALMHAKSYEAIPYFKDLIKSGEVTKTRIYAMSALYDLTGEAYVDNLDLKYAKDRGAVLKALDELARIGHESALEKIAEALGNNDQSVRSKAAKILGEIGGVYAIGPLINAYDDNYYIVRCEINKALINLTGSEYGYDKESWLKWWEENKRN